MAVVRVFSKAVVNWDLMFWDVCALNFSEGRTSRFYYGSKRDYKTGKMRRDIIWEFLRAIITGRNLDDIVYIKVSMKAYAHELELA